MKQVPDTPHAVVLRTDFSNADAWETIRSEIQQPVDGFLANVDFIDDGEFAWVSKEQLLHLIPGKTGHTFIVVADETAIVEPEHPLLVVDLYTEPGREFRALPKEIQAIENNLSIGNMDFSEFADHVDGKGVFRGFPAD
ncbi:MAG: hypothetical protein ABI556_02895 [Gemmatimonadales bacterium]